MAQAQIGIVQQKKNYLMYGSQRARLSFKKRKCYRYWVSQIREPSGRWQFWHQPIIFENL